ncbi:MAG: ComEC family competence protein, partial [Planctomycetes bacterium]|nr:ComEC family competence protein [Planctomycetota bacterium]
MAHRDTPPRLQAGRAAALQRTPLVAVVACFILGILVSYYGAVTFPAWASLAAAELGVVGGGLFLRRAALTTVGVLLAFCATGGAVYHYHCEHLPPGHIAEIVSDERALMKVRGYVCSDPTSRRKTPTILFRVGGFTTRWETAFDVRLNAVISAAGAHPAIGKTKVKLYAKNPGIRYGDELILTGQIQIPNAPTNPSQFDYREYLRRHGIRAILYVGGEAGVDRTGRSKSSVLRRLFALRRRLVSMVAAPSNGTGGKMLAAMLLGAREELPPEAEENFRQSGTVHLLAISGLHVGMVAGAVWLLIGMTGTTERVRSIVVILCVACYVFISGARPPAVRAAVMIVLIALGGVLNRR